MWSPHNPDILATACGDGHLRLFDLRAQSSPVAGPHPVATIPVGGEVLSLDWNKYRTWNIATGSTDKSVKVWDLRAASANAAAGPPPPGGAGVRSQGQIAAVCTGHEYAVRKVAFSVSRQYDRGVVSCSSLNVSCPPVLSPAPLALTPGFRKLRYDRPDMGRGPPFCIAIVCCFAPRSASRHGGSTEEGARCSHRICRWAGLGPLPGGPRSKHCLGHVRAPVAITLKRQCPMTFQAQV